MNYRLRHELETTCVGGVVMSNCRRGIGCCCDKIGGGVITVMVVICMYDVLKLQEWKRWWLRKMLGVQLLVCATVEGIGCNNDDDVEEMGRGLYNLN